MSIIWRKVLRDLWRSKFRTILVVISTAVGVFALGLVYGMSGVLNTRLAESHRESVPPHITYYTGWFDQEIVETIKREPDIADAERAFETPDAMLVSAGQQRGPRGRALRGVGIKRGEFDSTLGELVYSRGADVGAAVAAQVAITEVVGHDQDNVGTLGIS